MLQTEAGAVGRSGNQDLLDLFARVSPCHVLALSLKLEVEDIGAPLTSIRQAVVANSCDGAETMVGTLWQQERVQATAATSNAELSWGVLQIL
jgi:hypothetical protein